MSQPSRTTGTICIHVSGVRHRTYVHARKLRETPTRHLYPLPFVIRANQRSMGEAVETADSGRCVEPSAKLDIHVVRRRERLATETTEERRTCPGALLHTRRERLQRPPKRRARSGALLHTCIMRLPKGDAPVPALCSIHA